jgi:CheY-like chemotaxis protein
MTEHIMVVDDEWSMRVLYSTILRDEGWLVSDHTYATIKLTEIRQLHPDLIILDINMHQDGTGWSFLQLLKMDNTTADIPILVCTTADDLSPEIETYLAARHIILLHKPFEIECLVRTIQQTLAQAKQTHAPINLSSFLTVLVVEDNNSLRKLITIVLKMEGYKVMTAANGVEALDAVSNVQFSLILLDIEMPIMNGFEFLKAYDLQPMEHAPVIILSGATDTMSENVPPFVIDRVSKPFDVNHLLLLISKHTQPV